MPTTCFSRKKRVALFVSIGMGMLSCCSAAPVPTIDCKGVGDIRLGNPVSALRHGRVVREFSEPTDVGGQTDWATVRLKGQPVDVELNPARAVVRIKLAHRGAATRANIGVGSMAAEAARYEAVVAVAGDGQELILMTGETCGLSFVTNLELTSSQLRNGVGQSELLALPASVKITKIWVGRSDEK